MGNQIGFAARKANGTDVFTELVNENHERFVQRQQEKRNRRIQEKRKEALRRQELAWTYTNNTFYVLIGVVLGVGAMLCRGL